MGGKTYQYNPVARRCPTQTAGNRKFSAFSLRRKSDGTERHQQKQEFRIHSRCNISKKNDRPVSRVLCRPRTVPIIYLGLRSPAASICLPPGNQDTGRVPPTRGFPVYVAFHPVRFTYARRVATAAVGSYPAFSPLPHRSAAVIFCCTVCSRRITRRPLPVRKYGALRCPDFPHAQPVRERWDSLSYDSANIPILGTLPLPGDRESLKNGIWFNLKPNMGFADITGISVPSH